MPRTRKAFISSLLPQASISRNRPWDIQVHNKALYAQGLNRGSLRFGESYLQGWWDAERLDRCFTRILQARLEKKIKTHDLFWLKLKTYLTNRQTIKRAFKVGEVHYDLGNTFFEAMLGKTMVYTCAYWKGAETPDDAQTAKLDLVCRKLQLAPGITLLDINCGWGSSMRYAAQNYGANCTGISVSREQITFGAERCAGLPIIFQWMDYRDIDRQYDRVASIGMFKHVGKKNYAAFSDVARRATKADGLFLLHSIGSRSSVVGVPEPWLNKYIFPNGEIPALNGIITPEIPLFVLGNLHNFGSDYDKTLMAWHANFEANWTRFSSAFPPISNACGTTIRSAAPAPSARATSSSGSSISRPTEFPMAMLTRAEKLAAGNEAYRPQTSWETLR